MLMESKDKNQLLSGLVMVDKKKYALPLQLVSSIESMVNTKINDGSLSIKHLGNDTHVHELTHQHHHKRDSQKVMARRNLCVIIQDLNFALAVDEFSTESLSSNNIHPLPNVMVNNNSIISNVHYDNETSEVIFMLKVSNLHKYLIES